MSEATLHESALLCDGDRLVTLTHHMGAGLQRTAGEKLPEGGAGGGALVTIRPVSDEAMFSPLNGQKAGIFWENIACALFRKKRGKQCVHLQKPVKRKGRSLVTSCTCKVLAQTFPA